MSSGWNTPAPTPDQTPPPAPQQPQKKRSGPFKAGFLGCFGVLAAIVVAIIVIAMIAASGSDTGRKTVTGTPGAAADQIATSEPTGPASPPPASAFTLRVKTLDKQCFGDAGCNVTYRVELAYDGPALDPDVTWEVTYRVTGPEDGAQIGTLTVTGDKYERPGEEIASTSSASTVLKAKVIEVAEQ